MTDDIQIKRNKIQFDPNLKWKRIAIDIVKEQVTIYRVNTEFKNKKITIYENQKTSNMKTKQNDL